MNIDFNAAFASGMSREEILDKMAQELDVAEEKYIQEQEAKLQAEREAKEVKTSKEALKAEARAYIINGLLAYIDAFDLSDGEEIDEEDVKQLEAMLIKLEAQIPLYIKLMELNDKFDTEFFKGLM